MTSTRTLLALLITALLAGCPQPPDDGGGDGDEMGIAIGNPGVVSLSIAASEDVELVLAELPVAALEHHGCDASHALGIQDVNLDLTDGPVAVELLPGTWCGLRVQLAEPLAIEATWAPATGESAAISLELGASRVDLEPLDADTFTVDEQTWLALELAAPGWLDAELLDLQDGDALVVDADHELHLPLVDAVARDSQAFDDLDNSGLAEAAERDDGPLLIGGSLSFEPAPAGMADVQSAGCSTSLLPGAEPGLLLLLLALLGLAGRLAGQGPDGSK